MTSGTDPPTRNQPSATTSKLTITLTGRGRDRPVTITLYPYQAVELIVRLVEALWT